MILISHEYVIIICISIKKIKVEQVQKTKLFRELRKKKKKTRPGQ